MEWIIGIASFAFFSVILTLISVLLWEEHKEKKQSHIVDAEIQANVEQLEKSRSDFKVIK